MTQLYEVSTLDGGNEVMTASQILAMFGKADFDQMMNGEWPDGTCTPLTEKQTQEHEMRPQQRWEDR